MFYKLLKRNKTLRSLHVAYNEIGIKGAYLIYQMLKECPLEGLSVMNNPTGGIETLFEGIKMNRSLKNLIIGNYGDFRNVYYDSNVDSILGEFNEWGESWLIPDNDDHFEFSDSEIDNPSDTGKSSRPSKSKMLQRCDQEKDFPFNYSESPFPPERFVQRLITNAERPADQLLKSYLNSNPLIKSIVFFNLNAIPLRELSYSNTLKSFTAVISGNANNHLQNIQENFQYLEYNKILTEFEVDGVDSHFYGELLQRNQSRANLFNEILKLLSIIGRKIVLLQNLSQLHQYILELVCKEMDPMYSKLFIRFFLNRRFLNNIVLDDYDFIDFYRDIILNQI
jgi:hypothetical protein